MSAANRFWDGLGGDGGIGTERSGRVGGSSGTVGGVSNDDAANRPDVAPETTAITAGRCSGGTSLAPALWASSTWESESLDDAHRRATSVRHGNFYSRYANPDGAFVRAGGRRTRRRRGLAGVRLRHGRARLHGVRPVLQRQPHRHAAPAVRRLAGVPAGPVPAASGIDVTIRRRRRARRVRRRRRSRAARCSCSPRPRRTRASNSPTSTSSARSRGRSRSSTRRSPPRSASARSTTGSTSRCTRPRRASPATTTPRSA